MGSLLRRVRASRPASVRHRRGQALVEMALVITLLLTLVFGIIDFGFLFYRYVQAANCVRESARRAVVRDANAEDPPYCVDAGLSPDIAEDWMGLPAGSEVTATISVDHAWLVIGYVIPGLGSTIEINAETSMRMEGQIT